MMDIDVKNLHPLEVRLLRHVSPGEAIDAKRLIDELGYNVGQCNQSFSWLEAKGFVKERARVKRTLYELTDVGRFQAREGTPAERIFHYLKEHGPATLPTIAESLKLERSEVGSSFGLLSKGGFVSMNEENAAEAKAGELDGTILVTRTVLKKGLEGLLDDDVLSSEERTAISRIAKKRGAATSPFKVVEREEVTYTLTEAGEKAKKAIIEAKITGEELGLVDVQIAKGAFLAGIERYDDAVECLQAAIDGARELRADAGDPYYPTNCVAAGGSPDECGAPRHRVLTGFNPAADVLGAMPLAASLVFSDAVCRPDICPAVIGNIFVYRDDNHLSDQFALSLSDEMLRQLRPLLDEIEVGR